MVFKISEIHNVLSQNHKFILKNFTVHGGYTFEWRASTPTNYN